MKKDNSDIIWDPASAAAIQEQGGKETGTDGQRPCRVARREGGSGCLPVREAVAERTISACARSRQATKKPNERLAHRRCGRSWSTRKGRAKSARSRLPSCASVALETIARKKARRVQSLQQAGESPRPSSFRRLSSTAALPRPFR